MSGNNPSQTKKKPWIWKMNSRLLRPCFAVNEMRDQKADM